MEEKLRLRVWSRAGDRCEYCHLPQHATPFYRFHVEHVRAKQHHGKDRENNLALACPRCNGFKGTNLTAIDPLTDKIVVLFNPRTDDWDDHFALIGIEIVGRSEVGRATCELLRMNEEKRLMLRAALREEGKLEG